MSLDLDSVFVIDESADEALGAAMQKQDVARAAGDERGRALGLIKAADALVLMGRTDDAWGMAAEATAMCTEMKYEEGRAAAMNVMTKVHVKKGRDDEELEEALDSAMDTLKLFRKLSFRRGEAAALTTLASVYHATKKATLSIKTAKEALAIFAELGDKRAMAELYHAVMAGYLIATPPEPFLAAKQVQKASELYEELGDKSKQARCMHTVATVEKNAGDIKKAADALQKASALFVESGDYRGHAMGLDTTMDMLLDAGMYRDAIKVGKERVTIFRNAGDMQGEGKAMMRLGDVMMKNDDYEKAGKCAEVAMGLFVNINDMEGLTSAKGLVDGAKHAQVAADIEASIAKASCGMHVPATLIVDPGLNKRITGDFTRALVN